MSPATNVVEGDPRKSVSPDVLVAFGLGKKLRRTSRLE